MNVEKNWRPSVKVRRLVDCLLALRGMGGGGKRSGEGGGEGEEGGGKEGETRGEDGASATAGGRNEPQPLTPSSPRQGGAAGEKSVVFSQWTAFLDLLEIAFKR